jgi:tetratricopeptide (TPR) repeat protein
MDRAFAVLSQDAPDGDLAALAAQIGRFMFFAGQADLALERLEVALEIAEALFLPEIVAEALNTKAVVMVMRGRPVEAGALFRQALKVALDHDKPSAALRVYFNLSDSVGHQDRYDEAAELAEEGLALARRVGNRYWEWSFLGVAYPLFGLGRWDEALEREHGLPEGDWSQARIAFATLLTTTVAIRVNRGQLEEARQSAPILVELEGSADLQERSVAYLAEATLLLAEGRSAEAGVAAEAALELREQIGITHEIVKESLVVALEAAFALDDAERAERLLAIVDTLPPGRSTRFLEAQAARFRARLASRDDTEGAADALFSDAAGTFREIGLVFYLAVTLFEHAEWLASQQREADAEPLLSEARAIFEQLDARPWLERAGRVAGRSAQLVD